MIPNSGATPANGSPPAGETGWEQRAALAASTCSRGRANHCFGMHPLLILWAGTQSTLRRGAEGTMRRCTTRRIADRYLYRKAVSRPGGQAAGIRHWLKSCSRCRIRPGTDTGRQENAPIVGGGAVWTADLTNERMGAAQGKYQRELYLQRNEMLRSSEKFLASDKDLLRAHRRRAWANCNFLLSLADEVSEDERTALLMYNAATLAPRALSHEDGLRRPERLPDTMDGDNVDPLRELEEREEMAGKT